MEPIVETAGGSVQDIVRRHFIGVGLNRRQDLVAAEYRVLVIQMVIEPAHALVLIHVNRPAEADVAAIIVLGRSLSEGQHHNTQSRLAELCRIDAVAGEGRT